VGRKEVDPKPLLVILAIMCLHEVIAQVHIQEGANGKRASVRNMIVQQREGRGCGFHRTCAKIRKDLCLITK
jgi:hypothetical protein